MRTKDASHTQVARRMQNGRLAYYKQAATSEYWDSVWSNQSVEQLFAEAEGGELGYFREIFPKYLPKVGRILEAGCGLGQLVIALRKLGYDARGVDYGHQTVAIVKERFPSLPIETADVTNLSVEDEYYAAYISLGVMEHDPNGPDIFLREAKRILKPGGIALISVPHINAIRKLKAFLNMYQDETSGLEFYQYAYQPKEFFEYITSYGFNVLEQFQYGGYKGIKDELPFFSKIFEWPQGWRLRKFLMNWEWASRHLGHMMLFVARKS